MSLLCRLKPDRCQVHLRIANLNRSLEFYLGTLGLKVIERSEHDVVLGGTEHGPALLRLTEDPNARPRSPRAVGLYHFAIRYPDRRALAHALYRVLVRNHRLDGASDHDVSEAIYLRDPDGNGIELYADRPRSHWQWQDGQITMTTKPLDVAGLLALTDGEPAPPNPAVGADMGHVHLHVAHLAAAERFYREFLGFDATQRSYPGAIFLSTGGYHHHIAVNTWAGPAKPPANGVGLISYRFEIPGGLSALRERAKEFGYETREAPGAGGRLLEIRDPNGNWLEIQVVPAIDQARAVHASAD